MNNFKEGGFKKRGGDFAGRPKFGGGGRGGDFGGKPKFGGGKSKGKPSETFKAECSKCQKACTLPFRPNGEKPVFCSDCFAKNGPSSRDGDRSGGRDSRSDYSKPPRDQRPARHDRPQVPVNYDLIEIKQKLATIEARLNRVLDLINPAIPKVKSAAVETVYAQPEVVPVVVAKKAVVKKTVKKEELTKAVKKAVAAKTPVKSVAKKVDTKKVPAPAVKKVVAKKAAPKTAKKVAKKVTKTKK
jgi:CxxC-x17-CxxC domain-containing protein